MKTEFDDKAASWDDDPIRVARAETIAEVLAARVDLKSINNAMEYGSGTGLLSFALKEKLANVLMMDESEQMVAIANKKCQDQGVSHMRALKYDLMRDKTPDDQYDLIYILLTLHHIKDYTAILNRFYELLNNGGYLAIIDLEKEDGSFHDGEFHGHLGFDRMTLEQKLDRIGFAIKSYEVCYELEKERDGEKQIYPLFMLVVQKK